MCSYRGTVLLLGLLEDPGVRHVGDFCHKGQIVASETRGILPVLALGFVQPGQGDVVADSIVRLVGPDRGLDAAEPEFMNGLRFFSTWT